MRGSVDAVDAASRPRGAGVTPSPPERLLRTLIDICGPHFARPAGPGDVVAGRRARFVAAPGSTAAVADVLRVAADDDLAVVVRGRGTKVDWAFPPAAADLLLDTRRLAGVWHHRVDELTAEIGAGTPVRAVQAALALRGQRLAVDPPSRDATLGGMLTVNECGPLRHRFGSAQQQVIDYAYVDPTGTPGRRAAGPDGGLLDGGTPGGLGGDGFGGGGGLDGGRDCAPPPGVLLSAVCRLEPLPGARGWVTLPVSTPLQVHNVLADTLNAEVDPSAIEVDLPLPGTAWQASGAVSVLVEGDPGVVLERVTGLAAAVGGKSTITTVAPPWWGRYPFGAEDVVLRLTVAIAELHAAVYALRDAAGEAVPVRGSAGLGTVHAVLPPGTAAERVEQILDSVRVVLLGRGGRCVVVSAPPPVRRHVDMATRDELF